MQNINIEQFTSKEPLPSDLYDGTWLQEKYPNRFNREYSQNKLEQNELLNSKQTNLWSL